ncbi:uncharacterized protein TRIADDRAFT_52072 [Trichoplax adhaerens]|uniref:Uncharacterized protein n=1 Tax=Trichoplax adhaerens TaxID=10228 RepID=B3RLP1_TRIAD|nr:predicted protein [Trichoplax adhaerens]EDV28818.1 predicted protein [Trichoplax adhaerens]|eukprot:XP_002108020.1 predicted protein [Trichoplax adhaerens]
MEEDLATEVEGESRACILTCSCFPSVDFKLKTANVVGNFDTNFLVDVGNQGMGRKKKVHADCNNASDKQENPLELVFVAQYMRLNQEKYKFQPVTPTELLHALSLSDSSVIIDTIVKLLGSISARDRETIKSSWQSDLSEVLEEQTHLGNLLKEKNFQQLKANDRLSVLELLIWLNIEAKSEDLHQFAIDKTNGVARVQPVGHDSSDNSYWYLGGSKVFKQSASKRSRNKWEVICATIDDWKSTSKKFCRHSGEKEKNLGQAMSTLIPKVTKILESRKKRIAISTSKPNKAKMTRERNKNADTQENAKKSENVHQPQKKAKKGKAVKLVKEEDIEKQESTDDNEFSVPEDLLFDASRRKRKCVLQKQKQSKVWWDELSDSGEVSASSEEASDSEGEKKSKRKKNKKKENDVFVEDTDKAYIFTSSIANDAAEAVDEGLFDSIIHYHHVKHGQPKTNTSISTANQIPSTSQANSNSQNHGHDRSTTKTSYNPNSSSHRGIIDEYQWHPYHSAQQQQNTVHQQQPMVMHGPMEDMMLGYGMYPHQTTNPNDIYQRPSYQPASMYQPQIGEWSHQGQLASQNAPIQKMLHGVNYPASQQRIPQMMPTQQQTSHYLGSNEQGGPLPGLLYSTHSPLHRPAEQILSRDPTKATGTASTTPDNSATGSQTTSGVQDSPNIVPTTTDSQYYPTQGINQQPVGNRLSQSQQWQAYPMYMPQDQWQHYQHTQIGGMPGMPSAGFEYPVNPSQFSTTANDPSMPSIPNSNAHPNKYAQAIDKDRHRSAQPFSVEGFLSTKDGSYQQSSAVGQNQLAPSTFHSQSATTTNTSSSYPYHLQYQSGYGNNPNFYQHLSKEPSGNFTNASSMAPNNNYSSLPEVALPKENNTM